MRDYVEYDGEKFWIQTSGRYYQSGRKNSKERLLHRRIWMDQFGPIPEGFAVHHKDHNWRNNKISNLELMPVAQHAREHKIHRMSNPLHAAQNIKWLEQARLAAAKWHSSPEGLAWHVEHGKETWAKRKRERVKCVVCYKAFWTYWATEAKFCSKACRQKEMFQNSYTDARICKACGKEFLASRYRKTECCSRACANRIRAGHLPT